MRYLLIPVVLIFTVSMAYGQAAAPPSAEELAALKAHNQEIVTRAQGTSGVFVVQDDGSLKHLQSGLICRAAYPNVQFSQAMVYSSEQDKGADVGCDYIRQNTNGGASAKLSVFAVRPQRALTLDEAFAGYQAEVLRTYQGIRTLGPFLNIEDKGGDLKLPESRSQEFSLPLNNAEYTSQLIVAIRNGWVIEIRATFYGKSNEISLPPGADQKAVVDAFGDRLMATYAFFQSAGVGDQPAIVPAPP